MQYHDHPSCVVKPSKLFWSDVFYENVFSCSISLHFAQFYEGLRSFTGF